MKILDYTLKTLDYNMIIKIDQLLSMFEYGELIVIRHDKKIVIDTKQRDRKYVGDIREIFDTCT